MGDMLPRSNRKGLPMAEQDDHPLAGISPSRIANWQRHGVDAIEADLTHTGGSRLVGGPPGTAEDAWRWVRYMRNQERARQRELVTIRPGIWGMNLDLMALGRRIRNWWRSRRPG
jgi:hypothetical protein